MRRVFVGLLCLLAVAWGSAFYQAEADNESSPPAQPARYIQVSLNVEIAHLAKGATKESEVVNRPIISVLDGKNAKICIQTLASGGGNKIIGLDSFSVLPTIQAEVVGQFGILP